MHAFCTVIYMSCHAHVHKSLKFLLKSVGIIIIIIIIIIYTRNTLEVSDWVSERATTQLQWQLLLVRCVLCFRVTSAEDPAVFCVRTARRIQYTSQYSFRANKSSGSMQLGIWGWPLVQYKGELIAHEVGKAHHREWPRQILSLTHVACPSETAFCFTNSILYLWRIMRAVSEMRCEDAAGSSTIQLSSHCDWRSLSH